MNLASLALRGVQQAAERVDVAASRVSRVAAVGGDVVDLSAEMLALSESRNLNAAMVSVAHIAEEMDTHILNLLA